MDTNKAMDRLIREAAQEYHERLHTTHEEIAHEVTHALLSQARQGTEKTTATLAVNQLLREHVSRLIRPLVDPTDRTDALVDQITTWINNTIADQGRSRQALEQLIGTEIQHRAN